jgi:hypothetical protein
MESTEKVLIPISTCTITNGPAKYDFQASLFDKKIVQFSINTSSLKTKMDIGEKFNVTVHLAGPEDGSGDSWIGEFNLTSLTNPSISEKRAFWYNTKTRKGTVMESGRKWKLV